MRILLLIAALAFQPAEPPISPELRNPGFEQTDDQGVPVGWAMLSADGGLGWRFATAPGESGGRAGRLHRVAGTSEASTFAGIGQTIDAAPYRGRVVRYRARLRRLGDGVGGLRLRVLRPEPKSAGFRQDRPAAAAGWATYEIVGRVAPDALAIALSVHAVGSAEILIGEVSLEPVEPDPAPPSPEAAAYLQSAIDALRRDHIDSATADWARIEREAREEIGGADTPADTYFAIRGVIGALGEKHTMFHSPDPSRAGAGSAARAVQHEEPPMPTHRLVQARYGLVRLPPHLGSPEQSERYARTLRDALVAMDGRAVCGWIVDLRGNSGGNMWPMLRGLDPLLGEAPFGSFHAASGGGAQWRRHQGVVTQLEPGAEADGRPAFALRGAALPVAILIDGRTASSGEMVAIAFRGRPGIRIFGAPSAGFTTANDVAAMSDGAILAITSAFVRDRTGRDYPGGLMPDEAVDPAAAEDAAVRWFSAQPPCP